MDMSKIWGNIYDRSVAILLGTVVFEIVFFSTFWRLWKHFFWQKIFQDLISIFSFYPKNSGTGFRKASITQALLVVESCPTYHCVTLLIFRRLFYDLPCHLNGLILAWSTSLQLCLKNSRLMYEMFPFPKQVVGVTQFSDIMIVIELLLWNWKER